MTWLFPLPGVPLGPGLSLSAFRESLPLCCEDPSSPYPTSSLVYSFLLVGHSL